VVGAMGPVAEFPFSDLLQQPTRLASAAEERGRVVLPRRNAPDLVLSRASGLSELTGLARLLSRMVQHVPVEEVGGIVAEALPWTRALTETGRTDFVSSRPGVVQDGNTSPPSPRRRSLWPPGATQRPSWLIPGRPTGCSWRSPTQPAGP
jgi:hypothetical protein